MGDDTRPCLKCNSVVGGRSITSVSRRGLIGTLGSALVTLPLNSLLADEATSERQQLRRVSGPPARRLAHRSESLKVYSWTNRRREAGGGPVNYGSERGPVAYGKTRVKITWNSPYSPITVSMGDPVALTDISFAEEIERKVGTSEDGAATIFLPGYNYSFRDVIATAGVLRSQLGCGGPIIAASYPSRGWWWNYAADKADIDWSIATGQIKDFLLHVLRLPMLKRLHFVVHSLGAHALDGAFAQIDASPERERLSKVRSLIFAAPDDDVDIFDAVMLPIISEHKPLTILYLSNADIGMRLAEMDIINGRPRVGSTRGGIYLRPGIETIDVTEIDNTLIGHSTFVEPRVGLDMHLAICGRLQPRVRGLEQLMIEGKAYWRFKRW